MNFSYVCAHRHASADDEASCSARQRPCSRRCSSHAQTHEDTRHWSACAHSWAWGRTAREQLRLFRAGFAGHPPLLQKLLQVLDLHFLERRLQLVEGLLPQFLDVLFVAQARFCLLRRRMAAPSSAQTHWRVGGGFSTAHAHARGWRGAPHSGHCPDARGTREPYSRNAAATSSHRCERIVRADFIFKPSCTNSSVRGERETPRSTVRRTCCRFARKATAGPAQTRDACDIASLQRGRGVRARCGTDFRPLAADTAGQRTFFKGLL